MWCPSCHADVAAEVSSDNRRIRCASCNSDLGTAEKLPSTSKTREARELLKRWSDETSLSSSEPLADIQTNIPPSRLSPTLDATTPLTSPPVEKDIAENTTPAPISLESEDVSSGSDTITPEPSGQVFRIDNAHNNEEHSAETEPISPVAPPSRIPVPRQAEPSATPIKTAQIHNQHEQAIPKPHFDVQDAIQQQQQRKKINWASLGGQLLAYCGVGLITIGSALVLWGYFGGPTHYAPTGWLIATAGQMLMFLGVVTLVSGGLEQTTDEVSRQLEQMNKRLDRIDQQSSWQHVGGVNAPTSHFSGNTSNRRESA